MTRTPGVWNRPARSQTREEDGLLHATGKPPPLDRAQRIVYFVVVILCVIFVLAAITHKLGIWKGTL